VRGEANGRDRRRVMDAIDQANEAQMRGDLSGARTGYRQAADVVRALAENEPNEPDHRQQLGSALYTLGELLIETDAPGDAVPVLEEAEAAYTAWSELRSAESATAAGYVADVRLRRARAHLAAHHPASALVDSQTAVLFYLENFDDDLRAPFALEVARVLAHHSLIVQRAGDPDVAVAAADSAIRIYLSQNDGQQVALRPQDVPTLVLAAQVAEAVHGAYGRAELVRAAGAIVAQLPRVIDMPGPEMIRAKLTLAEALDRAGAGDLRETLVAPAIDCRILTSAHRCDPQLAPIMAARLAESAERVMDADPAAGMRLALEAHALYAGASRRQVPQMRFQFGELAPPWARLLLLCSRTSEDNGARAMALDFAGWMGGVVQNLLPQALIDPGTRSLARDCLSWHAELLAADGDTAGVENVRAALRVLDAPDDN
jgi:hypothetical protein